MKICVWDDNEEIAQEWKERLDVVVPGAAAQVHAATAAEIQEDLRILHDRRKRYLTCDAEADSGDVSSLDDTDILIVDNDLFDLPNLSDLSAETVASRAGIYTDCAYIVVLNLTPDLDFDLTLLGHPESSADLHINDRFVADVGLWEQCPKEDGSFRPWHWPLLLSAAAQYNTRMAELVAILNSSDQKIPILDYFGFEEAAKRRLSRSARAFLHPRRRAEEASFMNFWDGNAKAVNQIDAQEISKRGDVRLIARIGARRIAKWLAQYVVGPQEVLIDLPHLVEKMPFMIPGNKRECGEFWNSCSSLDAAPVRLVEEFGIGRFQREMWSDRSVYWTEGMETDENVERLLEATDTNPDDLVFCEDASSFHTAEMCDGFVAAHNSMSDGRFVRWLRGAEVQPRYGPQSRLAR